MAALPKICPENPEKCLKLGSYKINGLNVVKKINNTALFMLLTNSTKSTRGCWARRSKVTFLINTEMH